MNVRVILAVSLILSALFGSAVAGYAMLSDADPRYAVPVVLLVLLALGEVTYVLITRSVFQKIAGLKARVEHITRPDQILPVDGHDEINDLADSINTMLRSLQGSFASLKSSYEQLQKSATMHSAQEEEQKGGWEAMKVTMANLMEDVETEKAIIAEDKAKYEALLTSIGDGVVAIDQNGIILFLNNAARKILSLGEHAGVGHTFTSVIDVVDDKGNPIADAERPLMKALASSANYTTTALCYKRADGTSFPAAITVTPVLLGDKVLGAIEVFRDITREKEIDKVKTEFVSLASHQLRTPLSTINWYAEMLLAGDAGELNEEQRKYLEEVYTGNGRMVELVNSLLNVSRLELGTFMIEPQPISIKEIAQSMVKELRPMIETKHMVLNETYAPDLPEQFMADPGFLRMIFQNLLSNALKYTQETGTVNLTVAPVTKGNLLADRVMTRDSITITVADNGYGIPSYQQDRIFSKLFRADNAREKVAEGTGLGLYIIKSIVEQSEGMTWFTSEEGKGTTFYVTLPAEGMKRKEGNKKLE